MILAIDTSCGNGSVAIGTADQVRQSISFHGGGTSGRERHSTTLFTALTALDLPNQPLTRIVVGLGPGSFSGIRVALAAAQGLALPRNLPVEGVCSAFSVARQLSHITRLGVFADARRGDYYCTIYAQGRLERNTFVFPRAETEEMASKMTLAISADPLPEIPERCSPRASDFLTLNENAIELIRDAILEPIYLRPPI